MRLTKYHGNKFCPEEHNGQTVNHVEYQRHKNIPCMTLNTKNIILTSPGFHFCLRATMTTLDFQAIGLFHKVNSSISCSIALPANVIRCRSMLTHYNELSTQTCQLYHQLYKTYGFISVINLHALYNNKSSSYQPTAIYCYENSL